MPSPLHPFFLHRFRLLLFLCAGLLAAMPARAAETVVTILHTNDIHGHVLGDRETEAGGPGGLARAATLVRQVRADMPNVLLLDAGDIVQGTATEYITRGASMMAAMNALGYDAATLGNHEFDWSQEAAAANIARAGFPFLAANVRDRATGGVFGGAREFVILERGGVRVAVFGLTTLDTVGIEWPAYLSNARFEDPYLTAARLVPLLRLQADVVVALSHLGYSADRSLALIPGIDVVIGGHSHTVLSNHVTVGNTLIAQTGRFAYNLGRLDLRMEQTATGWAIRSINGQGGWWADTPGPPLGKTYPKSALIPVDASIPYDPAVQAAYAADWAHSQAALNEVLATALEDIPGQNATTVPRPLPLLLGDVIRRSTGADIALVPGTVGPELRAGPVSYRNVFGVIDGYTRRNLVMVRVTVDGLQRLIAETYATPGSYPAYLSGLSGRIDRTGGGPVARDLRVNGILPASGDTFTLVAPSYKVMDSQALSAAPIVSDQVGWMFEHIAEGMRRAGVLTAPTQTLVLTPADPVTLAFNAGTGTWALENGRLRAEVLASDGRVASLVKKTGVAAGTNQAHTSFRSFLDRVNRTGPGAPAITPNPGGSDTDDLRSLGVEYDIDLGSGRGTFHVRKTYRLARDTSTLTAEIAFRNDTGHDWSPADPQDGVESIVYLVPGGSAPAGDEVRVKTVQGIDVVTSGLHWWGAAPSGVAPRAQPAEGWLAAVDRVSGVVNVVTWDIAAQKAMSRDGAPSLKMYTGSNRFQVEPLFTRVAAGATAYVRQSFIVDDGIPDLSYAAPDALLAGVTVSAESFAGARPAVAVFRLNSTSGALARYALRDLRVESLDGRRALDLPPVESVDVAAMAHAAFQHRFALDLLPGSYILKADLYHAGVNALRITTLFSPAFTVGPPLSRTGDVDGDGQVLPADAALALRLFAGIAPASDAHLVRGDMDADGRMTLRDAVTILRR